ncbi:MAG: hypothetical protein WCR24_04015 [Candidatus Methanomethylophilaceae archaeon]
MNRDRRYLIVAIVCIAAIIVGAFIIIECSSQEKGDEYTYSADVHYSDGLQNVNGRTVDAQSYYIDCTLVYTDNACVWATYTVSIYAPDGTYVYVPCFYLMGYDPNVQGPVRIGMDSSNFYGVLDINSTDTAIVEDGKAEFSVVLPYNEDVGWYVVYNDGTDRWVKV